MSKFAVLLATERLLASNMNLVRKICIAIRIMIGLAALASILAFSVGCSVGSLLLTQNHKSCTGQVGFFASNPTESLPANLHTQVWRWVAVSVVDGVTELCILGTFCSIIWSLQMRRKLKITLTVLLGLRIM
jgi:hypothetical protein